MRYLVQLTLNAMKASPAQTNTTKSYVFTIAIVLSMILNSGVVAYAHSENDENDNEACPESLLFKGKELFEKIPEVSGQFTGEEDSENELGEGTRFWPSLPDWLEFPSWNWPFQDLPSTEDENDSTSEPTIIGQDSDPVGDSAGDSQDWSSQWVDKAETLLKSHGFEDTDGDGDLNWPEESPLVGGQNLDIIVVVTESSGIVIGFVPIAGDAVDVVAIVIAKDPITGECLSKSDQLLFALSLLLVVPVSAKTLKLVGKLVDSSEIDVRTVWKAIEGTLDKLEFKTHTWFEKFDEEFAWTFRNVRNVKKYNRVPLKHWRYRVVLGKGATTSGDLAEVLGYRSRTFSESNYREALITFTGRNKDEVSGLEAHHILPQEFVQEFQEIGFESVHDPRLLVWVDPSEHHSWSKEYSRAWRSFLELNPDASKADVLKKARDLSNEFGYDVHFRTSSWNPFRQLSWPF